MHLNLLFFTDPTNGLPHIHEP